MELEEYIKKAKETCLPQCFNEEYLTAGLISEIGEVADKLKHEIRDEKPVHTEDMLRELGDVLWYVCVLSLFREYTEFHTNLRIEQTVFNRAKAHPINLLHEMHEAVTDCVLGGTSFDSKRLIEYIHCMAVKYDSCIEEVAEINIKKLRLRKEKNMIKGSGGDRECVAEDCYGWGLGF